ncbi:MAG: hypothetical protein R3E53_13615 [Myxococcota bacterium]
MANTDPVNDDPSVTMYILDRAEKDSPARIRPIAAATRGLKGQVMTEMMALREAGAVAFSDDGATIMDAGVMRACSSTRSWRAPRDRARRGLSSPRRRRRERGAGLDAARPARQSVRRGRGPGRARP